jgi:hypothetical protein
MLAEAQTFTLDGISARPVRVEVDVHRGLPAFSVVGLPDAAVREARERVRAAMANCGFEFPLRRIVANLAPASMRKAGPGMDLAIACALLTASGQLEWQGKAEPPAMVGEAGARRLGASRRRRACDRRGGPGTRLPCDRRPRRERLRGLARRRNRGAPDRRADPAAGPGRRRVGAGATGAAAARRGARRWAGPGRPARAAPPEARAGGRGRRRPQPPNGRPARGREVDGSEPAALDPARAGAGGGTRGGADRERLRAAGKRPAGQPALPHASPHDQPGGPCRRRQPAAARRGDPGPPQCPARSLAYCRPRSVRRRIAPPGSPCARRRRYRPRPGVLRPADRQALSRRLGSPAPATNLPPRCLALGPQGRTQRGGGRSVAAGSTPPRRIGRVDPRGPAANLHSWTRQPAPRNGRKGFTPRQLQPHVSRFGGRQAETIRGHRPQGGKARPGRLRVSVSNGVLHTRKPHRTGSTVLTLCSPSPGAVRPRPLPPFSSRPGSVKPPRRVGRVSVCVAADVAPETAIRRIASNGRRSTARRSATGPRRSPDRALRQSASRGRIGRASRPRIYAASTGDSSSRAASNRARNAREMRGPLATLAGMTFCASQLAPATAAGRSFSTPRAPAGPARSVCPAGRISGEAIPSSPTEGPSR